MKVCGTGLAGAALLGTAGTARAQDVDASTSFVLNPTPDDIWMTNGIVYSMIRYGDHIYVGGKFQTVRDMPNGNTYRASNLARFHADTGVVDLAWRPRVTGPDIETTIVYALAAAGGKIWVGGKFDAVDGAARRNLAAVSPDTGVVDPGVAPLVGSETSEGIRAMVASSTKVYFGGYFTVVDGKARQYVAALDTAGNVDPTWKPRAGGFVRSLAFSCDGATVFAGGKFRNAAGPDGVFSPRETIARFDAASGALDPWAIPAGTVPNDEVAADLAVTCERITVAYLGRNFARSFRLDAGSSGTQVWATKCAGDVQTVAMLGTDKLIIGGHFSQVAREPRTRIAQINLSNGLPDPGWTPAVDGQFFGPWDLLVDGNHLYVGGAFTTVAGLTRTNFARFTFS